MGNSGEAAESVSGKWTERGIETRARRWALSIQSGWKPYLALAIAHIDEQAVEIARLQARVKQLEDIAWYDVKKASAQSIQGRCIQVLHEEAEGLREEAKEYLKPPYLTPIPGQKLRIHSKLIHQADKLSQCAETIHALPLEEKKEIGWDESNPHQGDYNP